MNKLQLFIEIGNIDEALIEASDVSEQKNATKKTKQSFIKYAVAACFALSIVSVVLLTQMFSRNDSVLQDESPLYHKFDSNVESGSKESICCALHHHAYFGSVDLYRPEGYHKNIGSALARTMDIDQDEKKVYTVAIGLHVFVRDFLDTYQIDDMTYQCPMLRDNEMYYDRFGKALKEILSDKWDKIHKDSWLKINLGHSSFIYDDIQFGYAAGLTAARINELAEMGYSVQLIGDGSLKQHQDYMEWIYNHMKMDEMIPFTFTYKIPEGMSYEDFAAEILKTINANQNDCYYMDQYEYEDKLYLVIEVLTDKEGVTRFKTTYSQPQPYVYNRECSPYDIKTFTEMVAYDKSFGDYIMGIK